MNMNFNSSMLDKNILEEIKSVLMDGTELYLIGGFLRDKFFGKDSFDMDFVVKGENAIDLARRFAESTGRYFLVLDEKFEIARVVDTDKIHYFDFARCENDDIQKDISRRDLTINSIAYQLLPETALLDKFNGIEDLKNKKIKIISEQNIIDDPLRILRIFRVASMLDFDIDNDSLDCAKKHCSLINNVAKERVLAELLKLFEGQNSAKYVKQMKEIGLLYSIFKILEKEELVPPNTHHHLTLIDHSIETVHQLELNLKTATHFVKNKVESFQTNGVKYLSLLKIACLLHDVGKYNTWTIEENGRHRFINHDSVGAELLVPILKDLKFSKAQIKYITTLVRNHIYPSQLAREDSEAGTKAIMRMFRKLDECTIDVLLLAMADRLSACGPHITDDIIENNLKALNRYLLLYENYLNTAAELPKLLDGNEIAEILNISKDKRLGDIIRKLQEAQVCGEISSKEEAIIFLKTLRL